MFIAYGCIQKPQCHTLAAPLNKNLTASGDCFIFVPSSKGTCAIALKLGELYLQVSQILQVR